MTTYKNNVKAIRLVESDKSKRSGRMLAVDGGRGRIVRRKQQKALEG